MVAFTGKNSNCYPQPSREKTEPIKYSNLFLCSMFHCHWPKLTKKQGRDVACQVYIPVMASRPEMKSMKGELWTVNQTKIQLFLILILSRHNNVKYYCIYLVNIYFHRYKYNYILLIYIIANNSVTAEIFK